MRQLLLLHGAIGSKEQLSSLAGLLSGYYDVHTLNFSGHGGGAVPARFNMDVFAADVLRYMDDRQIGQADIFGYSMGGYVALSLAYCYPSRIGKIMTLATKFDWSPATAEKESKMLDPDKIEQKLPAFADALRQRHAPQDWKMVLQRTAAMMREMGAQPPLTESILSQIGHKAMIGVGEKDKMVTVEETKRTSDLLKRGKFFLLENTPHPIEQIDSGKLKKACLDFFSSSPA
ncbi:MAG: alpha/beta hydrolase [Bacteroidota bacterium]